MNRKRREQIEAAMMRHPSTYHARLRQSDEPYGFIMPKPDADGCYEYFRVGDPIDTAQEFNADPWWLSYSRPRKAKLFDAMSVVVLVALIAAAIKLEWLIITGVWPR